MSPRISVKSPNSQRGFLIPLGLFILIGMLALALTATRLTGQSNISSTLEMVSTRAFYAAESGGQYAMHRIFFNNDQPSADGVCDGLQASPETVSFAASSAAALRACSVTISCERSSAGGTSFYTVNSVASCGSGDLQAQRTIEISAYMQ